MNDDLIVGRYQQRAGYRLADIAEMGIPVYSLNVQVLTLAHKRLPPIEEFLLRCLSLKISTVEEISQYLGLTREVLKPAFANLAQTENIALTAHLGLQSWSLTKKGQTTLQAAEIVAPEERTFSIHFDAVLRKPKLYKFQKLMKYRELKEDGLIEIEVFPPRQPQLAELSPGDIERVLKTIPGLTDQRRDVLAVRSVENVKKGFIRGVGLFFKGATDDDSQIAFVIDGILSTPHELAFAGTEGFKRLVGRIASDPAEVAEISDARKSLSVGASQQDEAHKLDTSTTRAEVQLAEQSEALRVADDENEKAVLIERLKQAEDELAKLRAEARKIPIKDIYVKDHPPLLQNALSTAERRLLIISPWIRAKVVNADFLKKLESLLRKSVSVFIGYGTSAEKDKTENLFASDRLTIEKMRSLAQKYPTFNFTRLGNTHAKVLIKDSEFMAVTSFNWLSFQGDPDKTFRDEQGTLIQHPEHVENKFNELVQRFNPTV